MVQHLSIRVPWHDSGWDGLVCRNPERNQACRVLKNIALYRNDSSKLQCTDLSGAELPNNQAFLPPCLLESGLFMSPHEITTVRTHPYTFDRHFRHLRETELVVSAYSFMATPYKWMLRDDSIEAPNQLFFTQYDRNIEPDVGSRNWISNGVNQKRIFDYFYREVTPGKSLVVAYAKAVPFVESPGRVVIGIGLVDRVGELCAYEQEEAAEGLTACLWERNIAHTIRTDRKNGFLFPFAEIRTYLEQHPSEQPENLVVIAPDEYRNEFSYATEHLSHDALVQTLNRTVQVLRKYEEIQLPCSNGASWDECIAWCEARLREVWQDRGAYPGLGSVLTALGMPFGFDVAKALKKRYADRELWDHLADAIVNLSPLLPEEQQGIANLLTRRMAKDIAYDIGEKRAYLELLSRLTLTLPQAFFLLGAPEVGELSYADYLTDIHKDDLSADILENPYLLYEKTCLLEPQFQIGIGQIDLAMFPPADVRKLFWAEDDENSVAEPDDERRLRAIITAVLERDTLTGSSLMLVSDVIAAVGAFRSDVPDIEPEIRQRTIQRLRDFFAPLFVQMEVELVPDTGRSRREPALQLVRLQTIDAAINTFVKAREDKEIDVDDDWEQLLENALGAEIRQPEGHEQASRVEKVAAIRKMARSRISVLTGGAGTGKTTTLVALCLSSRIRNGGILVLAPTGKARVVLSSKLAARGIEHTAKTVFQYLAETGHCDPYTWSYYLSGRADQAVPQTVIIDECSMLTEEMFGALAEAVRKAGRVIFVGDPNQLPPIGTGKPFHELVRKLKSQDGQPHYANLLVSNRQRADDTGGMRPDVELSRLFTEDMSSQVGEDLFERIAQDTDTIEFVRCKNADELPRVLFETLERASGITDEDSFDLSLGGEPNGEWMNFNNPLSIERWQILAPYRNREQIGTIAINTAIQQQFRRGNGPLSCYRRRKTPAPLGNDGILFGEKVINVVNQSRNPRDVYSPQGLPMEDCPCFVANGEVGLVTGLRVPRGGKRNTHHMIQFLSQPGYAYAFQSGVSESEAPLELAYALTVHKVQGSGFKKTIFVLIEPEKGITRLVTREMLYTALTRQTDKIFIIYNKLPSELKKYGSPECSDLARRKTSLFGNTSLHEVSSGWYDSHLIHKTSDGRYIVRSKSEVIVYNMLIGAGFEPEYERRLVFADGTAVLPDFTIETAAGVVYWEHLGMLGDDSYRRHWEWKRQLYATNGISEEQGNLILSQDDIFGAIDTQKIARIIDEKLVL